MRAGNQGRVNALLKGEQAGLYVWDCYTKRELVHVAMGEGGVGRV